MKINGKYTTINIPKYELEHITRAKELIDVAGIYFLMNGWELIYIGQSQEVFNRCKAHYDCYKEFDSILLLRIKNRWERELIESFLIEMFAPKYNGNDYYVPEYKENVQIWTPQEVKLLMKAITKDYHLVMFKTLLYSGMRYAEFVRLKDNVKWFTGNRIQLPSLKKKARQRERNIILNPVGREVVASYLRLKENPPTRVTWLENIYRWGEKANMATEGLSVKSTRKTYESWLVNYFPEKTYLIMLSQGHTGATAIEHYLTIGFEEADKLGMKEFVEGWG